jgi:hypothetical protein
MEHGDDDKIISITTVFCSGGFNHDFRMSD